MTRAIRDSNLQLELPLGHGGLDRRLASMDGRFEMRVTFVPGGAKVEIQGPLRLEAGGHMGLDWQMHVRVRPPVFLKIAGCNADDLLLDERCPYLAGMPDGDDEDSYGIEEEHLDLGCDDDDFSIETPSRDPILLAHDTVVVLLNDAVIGSSERAHLLAATSTLLNAVREHLVCEAIPEALHAVRSFDPMLGMSWFIYSLVANDRTGRLAQMVHVCPGLLILLRAFERRNYIRAYQELLERIVQGESLSSILRRAAELWVARARRKRFDPDLAKRQAAYVRMAGAGVSPDVLWIGAPLAMIPEDVPRTTEENARWYGFMSKAASVLEECSQWLRTSQAADLCRFFSLRALEIEEHECFLGYDEPETQAALLAGLVAATGRRISRKADLARLDVDMWELGRGTSRRALRHASRMAHQDGASSPFPYSPVTAALPFREDHISVELLGDPAAVLAEAKTMGHCVGSYIGMAMMGQCLLLHAEVDGQPLTVRLELTGLGEWSVAEIAGKNNREPSEEERSSVLRCLQQTKLAPV